MEFTVFGRLVELVIDLCKHKCRDQIREPLKDMLEPIREAVEFLDGVAESNPRFGFREITSPVFRFAGFDTQANHAEYGRE